MRFNKYLRWALAPALLLAAPAFASTSLLACFGSGTINTNPQMGCPDGSTATRLDALSMGASDGVSFVKQGAAGRPDLSAVTLLQNQSPASDLLLQDLYAGRSLGSVLIALYEGTSTTPSFTILLTGALVNNWQVSGSAGGGGLVESVSLLFTTITILDVSTNQSVSWDVVTNSP